MSLPVTVESNFTTAASAFATNPTDTLSIQLRQYVGIQYWENWQEAQNLLRSAMAAVDAAQLVCAQLLALAQESAPQLLQYQQDDAVTEAEFDATRAANAEASAATTIASVQASFPAGTV